MERQRDKEKEMEIEIETEIDLPLLIRILIPSCGFTFRTSFKPNYFPKALSPNTITLEVRASTYEFWGDINIQSITESLFL